MKLLMRWIQISDVHFQTKVKSFNTGQLRSKLPEYLNKIKNETGAIDTLIITGDYRYAPEGEVNTTNVYDYILKLADSISVACNKIVTVPGNHDLTRSSVRKAVILKREPCKVRKLVQIHPGHEQCASYCIQNFPVLYLLSVVKQEQPEWNEVHPVPCLCK